MALYHLHCDIIGRSKGKSAVGSILYQTRSKGIDETTGEHLDYRRKGKVDKCLYSTRFLPENCPKKFQLQNENYADFWNAVQKKEKRKNSQFARDFDIALQSELTIEQNLECLKKFFDENYGNRGLIGDCNIHDEHEHNHNIHAHLMISLRKIDETKEDGWGEKDREGNSKDFILQIRKSWADIVNAKFKELGIDQKIDERTLEEQGILDREPQQHQGVVATAILRKGKNPDRKKIRKSRKIEIDEIKTTETKIDETKKIDEEIQKLEELKTQKQEELKAEKIIEKMTPQEWQNYIKNEDKIHSYHYDNLGEFGKMKYNAEQKARLEFIKTDIKNITTIFYDDFQNKKNCLKKHDQKKPQIAKKPNIVQNFLYTYKTDDGKNLPYEKYKQHQIKLQKKWKLDREPIYQEAVQAQERYKHALNKDFKSLYEDCQTIPKLWEKIKEGAKKLYDTSPIFAPIRAIVNATAKLRTQKDQELKSYLRTKNQAKKSQERSR